MKVTLDAQPLLGVKSGIYNYVVNLARNLADHKNMRLFLLYNNLIKTTERMHLTSYSSFQINNTRYPYKVIRRLLPYNFLYNFPYDYFHSLKTDIFHGTNFTLIPSYKGRSVITIHDLAYMRYPETTSERIYRHHSRWVPYSAQNCDRIIAVSEQTKQDIIELLHIPESKIDVVYSAADSRFQPLLPTYYQAILEKHSLPENYILFVGTVEPRKNLIGLLKSYLLYKQNSDRPQKLVIVGAKGWKYSPIFDWIEANQLANDVIFTGFVSDEDLVAVYNGASVFVMPSLYEGFGIPILEAMACGKAVIGSDVSSIPEVIGNCGILIEPTKYEQWATEIYKILSDQSYRHYYEQKSLQRSKKFSWEKTAEETMMIYDKLINT